MALSSLVKSARHALVIDELRLFYVPAKWDNLDNTGGKTGLNSGNTGSSRAYQQMWFTGDHCVIGGSAVEQPLSAIALEWIVEGAGDLTLKHGVKFPPTTANPLFPRKQFKTCWSPLKKWWAWPSPEWELHPSALSRVNSMSDHRLKILHKMFNG